MPQQPGIGSTSSSSETFDVEVRIEGEHGQPVNIPLRVQLFNQMSVSIMQGYSRDGRAEFRGIPGGTYRIKVTGADDMSTSLRNTSPADPAIKTMSSSPTTRSVETAVARRDGSRASRARFGALRTLQYKENGPTARCRR